VLADLPVGENLQDQVIGDGITFFTPYSGVSVTVVKSENFHSAWIYSLFGTGEFSHSWRIMRARACSSWRATEIEGRFALSFFTIFPFRFRFSFRSASSTSLVVRLSTVGDRAFPATAMSGTNYRDTSRLRRFLYELSAVVSRHLF